MSSCSSLDPAPLGRTAAVVRLRGDVGNRADLEAGRLQRPDRGLAAGTGALHEHVDLLDAVLLRLAGGVLCGQLCGERRRLTRPLEADMARRRPGDDVALRIGDRHDRVVERALDVGGAVRDVLLFPTAGLLTLLRSRTALFCWWHLLTWPSSCRRWCASGPCGCAHWSWSAGHAPAGRGGAEGPGSSRSRSCGGCRPAPHGADHPPP